MNPLSRQCKSVHVLLRKFREDRRTRKLMLTLAYLASLCVCELLNLLFNPGVWIMAPFLAITLCIYLWERRTSVK